MGELAPEPRSLQEIERDDWGDPPEDTTMLISTVHRLRRLPVDRLDDEALRILLGQRVGIAALLPRALDRLAENPLCEGDFYPGDVLHSVLRTPDEYWKTHPEQLERLCPVIDLAEELLRADEFAVSGLLDEIVDFRKRAARLWT
ncbi:contact-dependent growth inhibition system immunity protein [Sciscionella sediminilitoris]|uniref:contact-dependent growth inhibition system immunity protein n=1 Tax=Sciscionella sediminilitoris TaxID=1445613 RepID=UPI000560A39A|nr:contact-dependent growth inhibition system immunity protein [Sciscionella sp. SE31]